MKLTPIEHSIIKLKITGKKNPAIAEECKMGVDNVKRILKKIYFFLGVRNRIELIYKYREYRAARKMDELEL